MREGRIWRDTSLGIGAKVWQVNWLYVVLLCALAGVGYAALYSAAGGAAEPYASRHVLRFATGLVLMIGIALVDIRFIARLAWPSYCVALVLLVLVMRYGIVGKGAQRWIELGGLQIQPSELMKITLVLALASWFHRASWERIGNPLFLIPPLVAVLVPVGLIVKEPNLGTAVITATLGAAMFFAAGVRWWKFLLVALPVPFAAQIVYGHLHDYQRARIDTFLQPESDPLGAGYNIIQSKIALGSGGMWGNQSGSPASSAAAAISFARTLRTRRSSPESTASDSSSSMKPSASAAICACWCARSRAASRSSIKSRASTRAPASTMRGHSWTGRRIPTTRRRPQGRRNSAGPGRNTSPAGSRRFKRSDFSES